MKRMFLFLMLLYGVTLQAQDFWEQSGGPSQGDPVEGSNITFTPWAIATIFFDVTDPSVSGTTQLPNTANPGPFTVTSTITENTGKQYCATNRLPEMMPLHLTFPLFANAPVGRQNVSDRQAHLI